MHTTMVPEQVKTMKIQAGIQVSRPRELTRQLQLWKRFGRLYLIVFVLVRNIGLSEGFWGEAMAVVRLPKPKRKILGEKGIDCMFIGYAEHSKAYRFYVIEPNEYISVNSVIESRDAMFDEKRFTSIPSPKSLMPSSNEDQICETPVETPTVHRKEDPRTLDEAMQSRDVAFWKEAVSLKIW
ncbi:hypothetical protein Tco_1331579 [Tanacetum coccineum]